MMSDYSKDVELDHNGVVVAARHLRKGEVLSMPLHLFNRVKSRDLNSHTISTFIPYDAGRSGE